jgi:hypothetical protein
MTRVVVTGSRKHRDWPFVSRAMNQLHREYDIEVVFHGEADGLDKLVKRWCIQHGIPVFGCPFATAYGKGGGPIRNGWLLQYGQPEVVFGFPLPDSRGTWDCLRQAQERGIPTRIITLETMA